MSCIIHGAHDFLDPSYYEFLLSSRKRAWNCLVGDGGWSGGVLKGALFQELHCQPDPLEP